MSVSLSAGVPAALLSLAGWSVSAGGAQAAASPPPAVFTARPTAVREGEAVKIAFAVSAPTDVSVWVEDAPGKIVRRLVSGVLGGKNPPPAPLKPGLAQEIVWDGKADLGKPAGAGPFTVRVGLGLALTYDREALSDRLSLNRIQALAAGRGGTLYVLQGLGTTVPNYEGERLIALNRDGSWGRMVLPPPAGLSAGAWELLGAVPATVGGRTVPIFLEMQRRKQTAFDPAPASGLAATPDGRLLVLQGRKRAPVSLAMVNAEPARQAVPLVGPGLLGEAGKGALAARAFLAVSDDGKHAYVGGLKDLHAVYRVRLPERTPAEPIFGDPKQEGKDDRHLSGRPGGIGTDGKGHLLIADTGNNRVLAVSEADGRLVGRISVERPVQPAVDPVTGAVYVLRAASDAKSTSSAAERQAEIVKFADWRSAEPTARLLLPSITAYPKKPRWDFALDASARPPVLWASDSGYLLRVEDRDGKFSDPVRVSVGEHPLEAMGDASFVDVSVDRWREPPEIYVRAGNKINTYSWRRVNEATLEWATLNLPIEVSSGSCLLPGPDGHLYTLRYPVFLSKWDHAGKPLKWEAPFVNLLPKINAHSRHGAPREANAVFVNVAMTFMTHTHGIRHDGHHFVFESRGRCAKALCQFAPSGRRVGDDPVIWTATDMVQGPRFDPQGNIYVADVVRPLDQLVPREFSDLAGNPKMGMTVKGRAAKAVHMYGSVMKFSPKGGAIEFPGAERSSLPMKEPKPYDGEMKLDPSLKTMDMAACGLEPRFFAARVTGAEWAHFGFSHIELTQCNCESVRFDVDWFSRVWYPDMGRYRVGVLDSSGNVIGYFGGYGNTESGGPGSKYPDPELGFTYLNGVGASDRYAYMGDSINQRLLRAKITYAAEETCAVGP